MWRAMHKKHLCLSPLSALQSGNAKGDPRGNVLARFLGYFFDVRQRSNIKSRHTERAKLGEAVEVVVKHSDPHPKYSERNKK